MLLRYIAVRTLSDLSAAGPPTEHYWSCGRLVCFFYYIVSSFPSWSKRVKPGKAGWEKVKREEKEAALWPSVIVISIHDRELQLARATNRMRWGNLRAPGPGPRSQVELELELHQRPFCRDSILSINQSVDHSRSVQVIIRVLFLTAAWSIDCWINQLHVQLYPKVPPTFLTQIVQPPPSYPPSQSHLQAAPILPSYPPPACSCTCTCTCALSHITLPTQDSGG